MSEQLKAWLYCCYPDVTTFPQVLIVSRKKVIIVMVAASQNVYVHLKNKPFENQFKDNRMVHSSDCYLSVTFEVMNRASASTSKGGH